MIFKIVVTTVILGVIVTIWWPNINRMMSRSDKLSNGQIEFLDRHAPDWRERVARGESLTFNMDGDGTIKFEEPSITFSGTAARR